MKNPYLVPTCKGSYKWSIKASTDQRERRILQIYNLAHLRIDLALLLDIHEIFTKYWNDLDPLEKIDPSVPTQGAVAEVVNENTTVLLKVQDDIAKLISKLRKTRAEIIKDLAGNSMQ